MDVAMLPRYSEVAPFLERGMAADRGAMMHPMHTLPPCTVAARFRKRLLAKQRTQRDGWMYSERCEGCALKERCQGIPEIYLARFGDAEIKAIAK
jgi:hypothetical protein